MGLVAMLLACKYEEVSVPVVDDLIFISDKAYTRKELLEMVGVNPLLEMFCGYQFVDLLLVVGKAGEVNA